MKNSVLILLLLLFNFGFAQETEVKYDENLAKSLKADEYGMKKYVFCLLKSGTNTTASKEESKKLFEGHMANVNKLANEGKLVVAGPFMKNDRNYRGIYIFNVETVDEAKALVETDPAIKAKLLEAELTPWYCTAALQETVKIHEKNCQDENVIPYMKTEKEKMISGEYYNAFDPELLKGRRAAKNLLHSLNVKEYRVTKKAKEILKELIPNTGEGFYIEPPFHCDYGYNIFCGDNVYFNVNCVVLDCAPVNIGSNVFIAPNVQIYTASHPLDAELRKSLENAYPVTIGDDCWIGGNSVICPGVTIGKGCVIGAGSVVTKDIPDNSLAVGNPAKVIRKLNQEPESK